MEPIELINFFNQKKTLNTKPEYKKFSFLRKNKLIKKPIKNLLFKNNQEIFRTSQINDIFLDLIFKKIENQLTINNHINSLNLLLTLLGLRRLNNQLATISISAKWKKNPNHILLPFIKEIIKLNKEKPLIIINNLSPTLYSFQPIWLGLDWFLSVWWQSESLLRKNIEHNIQFTPLKHITFYSEDRKTCTPKELNDEFFLISSLKLLEY